MMPLGPKAYRKRLCNHRMTGPCSGVKTADLKKIRKRIRKDHRLDQPSGLPAGATVVWVAAGSPHGWAGGRRGGRIRKNP
jgi:hypothetical protein